MSNPNATERKVETWTVTIEADQDDEQSKFMRLGLLTWLLQVYGMRLVRYTEGDTCCDN